LLSSGALGTDLLDFFSRDIQFVMAVSFSRAMLLLSSFLATIHVVAAQVGANTAWTEPNGSLGDFGETFSANTTVNVAWQPLNSSISDLWITAWNLGNDDYAERMEQSINISFPGSIEYGFTIPDIQLSTTAQYVFHFVPVDAVIGKLYFGPSLSSPGFLVLSQSNVTVTNAISSSALVPTSTMISFSTSVSVAPTSSSSSGMGAVAKACIAIGVTFGVVLVAMGAFLFARRYREKQVSGSHRAGYNGSAGFYMKKEKHSFADSSTMTELPGRSKATEMDGSRPRVEAPSGQETKRLHEYIHELGS
jgi:hypothetical protein